MDVKSLECILNGPTTLNLDRTYDALGIFNRLVKGCVNG